MIGWLRSLLDKGEAKEREQVKQQVEQVITDAERELKASKEFRLKRMNLEIQVRRRHP